MAFIKKLQRELGPMWLIPLLRGSISQPPICHIPSSFSLYFSLDSSLSLLSEDSSEKSRIFESSSLFISSTTAICYWLEFLVIACFAFDFSRKQSRKDNHYLAFAGFNVGSYYLMVHQNQCSHNQCDHQ